MSLPQLFFTVFAGTTRFHTRPKHSPQRRREQPAPARLLPQGLHGAPLCPPRCDAAPWPGKAGGPGGRRRRANRPLSSPAYRSLTTALMRGLTSLILSTYASTTSTHVT